MEYPIQVTGIQFSKTEFIEAEGFLISAKPGDPVAVRPCGKEYEGKTYVGFFIGNVATTKTCQFKKENGVLTVDVGMHNPAMFVPALKRVVYGYESWWGKIESLDDAKKITDSDIEGSMTMKLLDMFFGEEKVNA
jgi:hypothetical protein